MDTSETYIKMCDCRGVQEGRQSFDCFDFLVEKDGLILHSGTIIDSGGMGTSRIYFIWLPRQDQIQEMMSEPDTIVMFSRFVGFFVQKDWHDLGELSDNINNIDKQSAEQLWLAFYMHEKHKKTWDGEKWVKYED